MVSALRRKLELRKESSNSGFSFIELVIVVAVIGILTAIAIPAYGAIQTTAKTNTVAAAAQQAYSAGMAEFAEHGFSSDAHNVANAMSTEQINVSASGTSEENFKVTARWVAEPNEYVDSRGFEPETHNPYSDGSGPIEIS